MEVRKLLRNTTNKMIGGVCSGLGDYFTIDPVLVRIIFVLAAIFFGSGFLLYLILWIMMPEAPIKFEQ